MADHSIDRRVLRFISVAVSYSDHIWETSTGMVDGSR